MCPIDASVIVVNWNTRDMLLDCLRSVRNGRGDLTIELVVVDNGSRDGSVEAVRRDFPDAQIIVNEHNVGFARAANQGMRAARGRHMILLNSDTTVAPDAILQAVRFLDSHPTVGAVGAQLLNADGSRQTSYDNFPTLASELLNKSILRFLFPAKFPSKLQEVKEPKEVQSLIGAFMAVPQHVTDTVGLLDEDFFFFLEETDWCLRIKKAGYRIIHLPQVHVWHLQGASKTAFQTEAKIEYLRSVYRFFKKNRRAISYLILRLTRPVQYLFNTFFWFVAGVVTLFLPRSVRQKLGMNLAILLWHVRMCPASAGLSGLRGRQ